MLIDCPACGRSAVLIRNGLHYGNAPDQSGDTRIIRGQRIRCSNRGNRCGCGCSFSIFESERIPGRSIDTSWLQSLLLYLLQQAGCMHAAWLKTSRQFSLRTAYRIWRRIDLEQTTLRHRLCQCTGPPNSTQLDPRLELIEHLRAAFIGNDFVCAYQKHFQTSILPVYTKHSATPSAM